jgi:hypothetical protein
MADRRGYEAHKFDGSHPLGHCQVDFTREGVEMTHQTGHHFGQAPISLWPCGGDNPVGEGGIILGFLGYAAGLELHSRCWRWVGDHLAHVESRGCEVRTWLGLVRQAVQCGGCFQGGSWGRIMEDGRQVLVLVHEMGTRYEDRVVALQGNARKDGWPRTNNIKVLSLAQHILRQRGSGLGHTKAALTNHQPCCVASISIACGSCRHPSRP